MITPPPPDRSGSPAAPHADIPPGAARKTPPALPRPVEAAWVVRTEAGSVYYLSVDAAGRWWFGGANVPHPGSTALPAGRCWQVEPPVPWPPALGARPRVEAPPGLAADDPARVPHGGKWTSSVRAVEWLGAVAPADAAPRREPGP